LVGSINIGTIGQKESPAPFHQGALGGQGAALLFDFKGLCTFLELRSTRFDNIAKRTKIEHLSYRV
jgi:hypothetical protein